MAFFVWTRKQQADYLDVFVPLMLAKWCVHSGFNINNYCIINDLYTFMWYSLKIHRIFPFVSPINNCWRSLRCTWLYIFEHLCYKQFVSHQRGLAWNLGQMKYQHLRTVVSGKNMMKGKQNPRFFCGCGWNPKRKLDTVHDFSWLNFINIWIFQWKRCETGSFVSFCAWCLLAGWAESVAWEAAKVRTWTWGGPPHGNLLSCEVNAFLMPSGSNHFSGFHFFNHTARLIVYQLLQTDPIHIWS